MLRKIPVLLLLILAIAATAMAGDMTVDELIAKNIEARGGMEAIKAIETVRLTGKMDMGGMVAPVMMEWKRPNKLRLEFEIQGMTGIQAVDGDIGWGVMPFMGKVDPEPMADDQLKATQDMADFDGHLVDYKEKGHTIELVGETEVEGTPAYELSITKANGDVVKAYLDAEYFIEFREVGSREQQGVSIDYASNYGDYKEVAGVLMAHSIEMGGTDGTVFQTVTIESIETGVDLPDDRFTMPEVTTETADDSAESGE